MRLDAAAQLHAGEKYLAIVKHLIRSSLLYRITFVRNIVKHSSSKHPNLLLWNCNTPAKQNTQEKYSLDN